MGEASEMLRELRASFDREGAFGKELTVEEVMEGFVSIIEPLATDDFYCVMDGGALTTRYEGIKGMRVGWADFLGAFETLKIEPVNVVEEASDGRSVVEFVLLSGKPKGIDARIEAKGAGVWRLRGDGLEAVEFHMDRERALRSVGLEPG